MGFVKIDLSGLARSLLGLLPPPTGGGDSVLVKIVVQMAKSR